MAIVKQVKAEVKKKAAFLSEKQSSPSSLNQSLLLLILGLALIRGIIYAAVIPPWQAPDEPAHFERARAALDAEDWFRDSANAPAWYDDLRDSLLTFKLLNYTLSDAENDPESPLNHYIILYQELSKGAYANRPTYAVLGFPLVLTQDQNVVYQLYLVRLGMILINVIIIFFAYLITRTIFPKNDFLIVGVPLLILFNPQHTHMLSTVNNGNLSEVLVVIVLYFLTIGLRRGFSRTAILIIIGCTAAAFWTKATSYFLIAPLGAVCVAYLWKYRQKWPYIIVAGGVLAGLTYLFSPERFRFMIGMGWTLLKKSEIHFNPFVPERIFASFWAMPGWAILRLIPIWYQVLLIVCLLGLIGLVLLALQQRGRVRLIGRSPSGRTLLVLGIAVIAAIGVQLGWHILSGTLNFSQGRSIYPVMIPIAIFLMLGWQQLIPPVWQRQGLVVITTGLVLFDSMVLFSYIIPFFYSGY